MTAFRVRHLLGSGNVKASPPQHLCPQGVSIQVEETSRPKFKVHQRKLNPKSGAGRGGGDGAEKQEMGGFMGDQ